MSSHTSSDSLLYTVSILRIEKLADGIAVALLLTININNNKVDILKDVSTDKQLNLDFKD